MKSNNEKRALFSPKTGGELLDLYFLEARSHILETAAIFDRIQRAGGGREAMKDSRVELLKRSCDILAGEDADRTKRFLTLFSDS